MRPLSFFLLGRNISYSASPAMMAAAFTHMGLPHTYELADIAPDDLPATVEYLRTHAAGANVTVPYKRAVAQQCDTLSDVAAQLGAVNTVVVCKGTLHGENTDYVALVREFSALQQAHIDAGGAGFTRAAVLGNGGAAAAVRLALAQADVEVITLARSAGTWEDRARVIPDCDLLVNATPIGTGAALPAGTPPTLNSSPSPASPSSSRDSGTAPDSSPTPESIPVDPALLRRDLAVFDLVYRPTPTPLVAAARARGAAARAGAGMLAEQGRAALQLWLQREVPAEPFLTAVLHDVGASDV